MIYRKMRALAGSLALALGEGAAPAGAARRSRVIQGERFAFGIEPDFALFAEHDAPP